MMTFPQKLHHLAHSPTLSLYPRPLPFCQLPAKPGNSAWMMIGVSESRTSLRFGAWLNIYFSLFKLYEGFFLPLWVPFGKKTRLGRLNKIPRLNLFCCFFVKSIITDKVQTFVTRIKRSLPRQWNRFISLYFFPLNFGIKSLTYVWMFAYFSLLIWDSYPKHFTSLHSLVNWPIQRRGENSL